MIGFYDLDLYNQKGLGTPNVDIMKLSSYYQKEEGQFCRLLLPDETDFEGYDKIYVFSENIYHEKVPMNLRKAGNIVYGGTGFTDGVYVPFKNKLIDYSLPSTQIYKNYLSRKMEIGESAKDINKFLDACYYRCYAGDDKLPMPRIIKHKQVFLYDREFFFPDWETILTQLSKRKPINIIRIHPVYCKTLTQFFTVRNYPKFSRNNEIVLNLDIPTSQFFALFNKYQLKFKADIGNNSRVMLPIGGNYISINQYYDDLVYTLNFLYSFWCRGIMMKLHLEPTKKGNFNPIEDLTRIIVNWAQINSSTKKETNIIDFIKYSHEDKEAARNQFGKMIKYNPKWETLFKQNFIALKERGYWLV